MSLKIPSYLLVMKIPFYLLCYIHVHWNTELQTFHTNLQIFFHTFFRSIYAQLRQWKKKVMVPVKNLLQTLKVTETLMSCRRSGKLNKNMQETHAIKFVKAVNLNQLMWNDNGKDVTNQFDKMFTVTQWLVWLHLFSHRSRCVRRNWWNVNYNRCAK